MKSFKELSPTQNSDFRKICVGKVIQFVVSEKFRDLEENQVFFIELSYNEVINGHILLIVKKPTLQFYKSHLSKR